MATRFEIEQRRIQIEAFLARGFSQTVIAKTMGVSRITINKDVQWIKAKNRSIVTDLSKNQVIGDAVARYNSLEQMALAEFSAAPAGETVRGGFILLAGKMREAQIKLLQSTGFLPKDGKVDEDEWSLTDGVDPSDISLEELKAIAHKAALKLTQDTQVPKEKLQKLLKSYENELSAEVVDVAAVEKEPDEDTGRDARHPESEKIVETDTETDTGRDSGVTDGGTDDTSAED